MFKKSRRMGDSPLKPVKRIEVSVKNRKLRLILIVLLLAVGVTLIATSVASCFSVEPGWHQIKASALAEDTCAGDFVFLYLIGESGQSTNTEQNEVTQLYTQATTDAFQIFHEEQLFGQVHNVAYLN